MVMQTKTITILIADDQEITREGYRQVLENQAGLQVVAVVGDGQQAVVESQRRCPDVVMLDIRMPNLDGLHAADQIRAVCPQAGIILLSFYDDPRYVRRFFRRDAAGKAFLLKQTVSRIAELVRAIHAVADGQSMLDPGMVNDLLNEAPAAALQDLTPQELRVLALMAKGYSNTAIAAELVVQERTVENYASNVFAKLHLRDKTQQARVQAVLLFLDSTGRLRHLDDETSPDATSPVE